jgi:hypothetical protein
MVSIPGYFLQLRLGRKCLALLFSRKFKSKVFKKCLVGVGYYIRQNSAFYTDRLLNGNVRCCNGLGMFFNWTKQDRLFLLCPSESGDGKKNAKKNLNGTY